MRKIYYSDKEYEQIIAALGNYVNDIEKIDNPLTKELVYTLMQHLDIVHREGLARMWKVIKGSYPDLAYGLKEDFTVHHLLALYDLENSENYSDN